MFLTDEMLKESGPRESAGADDRAPSPLSDTADATQEEKKSETELPQAPKKKTQDNYAVDEKKLQPNTITIDTSLQHPDDLSGGVSTTSPDRPSPLPTQSQEHHLTSRDSQSQRQSYTTAEHMMPQMVHHRPTEHIPHMPALMIPNMPNMRGSVASAHLNGYHTPTVPMQGMPLAQSQMMINTGGSSGKRKIHLRLLEDIPVSSKRVSFLGFGGRKKKRSSLLTPRSFDPPEEEKEEKDEFIDRGRVTVSWYEGTTSMELLEHVQNSVKRKLGLDKNSKLSDLRILDEGFDPPEEIVLSPYIPDGSRLLLRFSTQSKDGYITPPIRSYSDGPPISPSAAPSPYRSSVDLNGLGLNPNQLAMLGTRLKGLDVNGESSKTPPSIRRKTRDKKTKASKLESKASTDEDNDDVASHASTTLEMNSLHPEDQIEKSLRQITELLLADRTRGYIPPRREKRQVIFTLANYFVLFLSLIAISAEIQARAPQWHKSIEQQFKNVQSCSKNESAMYECISQGDFAGLIASVVLWISRSAATRRIFLFGFESPRKLWTVVYECMVTSVCWGFSYMFIRRGMNPDTSQNFLQKYWKDAVYGSLAGFNAAFMKHVLKNLIPQEAIEDVLMQDRKLKILSWLQLAE